MTWIELAATVLGVLCVALAAGRSVWTFPTAIGSAILVGWVVWQQRLYSDALLQGFFVAANLYGWVGWRRSQELAGAIVVERLSPASRRAWGMGCVAATLAWGGAMATLTDADYAWWDAATAVASVAAQLLMAQRKLENWVVWIAVDMALIPLYLAKGLTIFAFLYLLYLLLAVIGLIGWGRAERGAGA
ncbi:nicotinamide riboside transporter PnuC [Sphingomonas sp.]|jgi:nicotinamide mononucleotide transporter|uniref:nicotinamide riboside transporter PnuC n=1 Tax=Sphingomonas sp. TaxID=28214 RepID=UPI002D7EF424|nr:nicotinamide riboside transporter PnuC [Sphingomonas sp.]HEU0044965.1 nicotinamide riboside transporter PnuC [Sphingomonas sp.]